MFQRVQAARGIPHGQLQGPTADPKANGLNAAGDGAPGVFCAAAPPAPPPPPPSAPSNSSLQKQLAAIVERGAERWTLTFSAAIATPLDSEAAGGAVPYRVASAAAGYNSHALGTKSNVHSLFPSGSVTKAYTAAACLKQAETGNLDLDKPISFYLDPWFHRQGIPPLATLWEGQSGGDIAQVTTRMLLQMRSGIGDYDDGWLFEWTLQHPNEDFGAMDLIYQGEHGRLQATFLAGLRCSHR